MGLVLFFMFLFFGPRGGVGSYTIAQVKVTADWVVAPSGCRKNSRRAVGAVCVKFAPNSAIYMGWFIDRSTRKQTKKLREADRNHTRVH